MGWILGEELGRGAIGRVVRVTDPETGEVRAGKVLHESNRDDPAAAARFAREAELAASLVHENIARVHGVAEIEGQTVLLMELVSGPSLTRVLAIEGTLPEARIITVGRGIAAGLGAAHRAGIVHRDLKPSNVLLADGDTPKIVDFGMARATSFVGVDRFALVGTPDYMAPECVDPMAVDPRSDLYALGCILFEMAIGRPPFSGATAFALLEAHGHDPVPEVTGVTPELAALIRSLLAKSPADRPQSALAVAAALGERLALAPRAADARGGRCVACDGPLVLGVAVCFGCGASPLVLEDGPMTVGVTGPGTVVHKLDSGLRGRLLAWLRKNPQLGLDPAPLEKKIPRLPFVVASGISDEAAHRLAEALRALGLEAAVSRGGAFSVPALREKAWKLAGRRALIGFGMIGPFMGQIGKLPLLLAVLVALPAAFAVAGFRSAGKKVALPTGAAPPALPSRLAAAVARTALAVPAIEARRHREGLRAVVQRLLALHEAVPALERARIEADLAHVLDLATAAALRVDELEGRMAGLELRDVRREELQERDAWAARLLDAAAQLEALRARWAAARARGAATEIDDALAGLRAEVEAFEEVQAL